MELKFRAWDTKRNQFVDEGEICFCFYGDTRIEVHPNSQSYIGDEVHNGEPQRGRFIIEQFTGLTDKNGKEIYENDLLKNGNYIYQIVYGQITNKADLDSDIFIVGWLRKWQDGDVSPLGYYRGIDGDEIIGNIHESPELLNQ